MTDDLVARLPTDAAARRLPEFIKMLRINRAARRESVYASDNVYALLDALDTAGARIAAVTERADVWKYLAVKRVDVTRQAVDQMKADRARTEVAEARVRELEAHCKRLGQGGAERYWEERWRDADARLSTIEAETIERCAKVAAGCDLPARDWMPGSLYDKIRREVAAAIRSMGKEEQ